MKAAIKVQARRKHLLDPELAFLSWLRRHEGKLWDDFIELIKCDKSLNKLVIDNEISDANTELTQELSQLTNPTLSQVSYSDNKTTMSLETKVCFKESKDYVELSSIVKPNHKVRCTCKQCLYYKTHLEPKITSEILRRKDFYQDIREGIPSYAQVVLV